MPERVVAIECDQIEDSSDHPFSRFQIQVRRVVARQSSSRPLQPERFRLPRGARNAARAGQARRSARAGGVVRQRDRCPQVCFWPCQIPRAIRRLISGPAGGQSDVSSSDSSGWRNSKPAAAGGHGESTPFFPVAAQRVLGCLGYDGTSMKSGAAGPGCPRLSLKGPVQAEMIGLNRGERCWSRTSDAPPTESAAPSPCRRTDRPWWRVSRRRSRPWRWCRPDRAECRRRSGSTASRNSSSARSGLRSLRD